MIGLEEILKVNGISVADLAKDLGIARGNIYNWLNSKRKIPQATLEKLSERFNVPKEYFSKELTEVERLKVKSNMIGNLINETTNEYEDIVINQRGEEEKVIMEHIDYSLVDAKNKMEEEIEELETSEKIINRVSKIFKDKSDNTNFPKVFNEVINCIENTKAPLSVLQDVFIALDEVYGTGTTTEKSEFVTKLIADLKENKTNRENEKKKIDELIKSSSVWDLFK